MNLISHRTITALAGFLLLAGIQLAAQTQDQSFFAERRAAFERTGQAPTVPPSLSADPADPEHPGRDGQPHPAQHRQRLRHDGLPLAGARGAGAGRQQHGQRAPGRLLGDEDR